MEDPPAIVPPDPLIETLAPDHYRVVLPEMDYRSLLRPGRASEVAMIIQRDPDWVLLQTKQHYPPGIFRLPTGTVQPGEDPDVAMVRELHEEANLSPGEVRHLFRLEYIIEGGRRDFVTDGYQICAPVGQLRSNDPAEAIEAWREATLSDLGLLAAELRRLEDPWRGWGIFRSVMHRVAAMTLAR